MLIRLRPWLLFSLVAALVFAAACRNKQTLQTEQSLTGPKPAAGGRYTAQIQTDMGEIDVELFPTQAPLAVGNFVGLATGKQAWLDPTTMQVVQKPLYNGTIFHRVIPGFMIQGGDPLGNGQGNPGYQFPNEISPDLKFDRAGRLGMANAGPDTNGSQFFITVAPQPHLDGGYTVFGQVTKGQDVVDAISKVPRDPSDRPLTPIHIVKITVNYTPS
jgi:peptidyl-prolyl cis-trans isomerase A (cyclophilin A)